MVKLEENLSFAKYVPWKVSGKYRAYLGFLKRYGHLFRSEMRMFQAFKTLSKGLLTVVDIFYKQLYDLLINVIPMPVCRS